MKRGFLNSRAAKEKPIGAPPVAAVNSKDVVNEASSRVVLDESAFKSTIDLMRNQLSRRCKSDQNSKALQRILYIYRAVPNFADEPEQNTQCLWYPETYELLSKTPGFPQRLPPAASPPAFRVAPSPGKGMGLFSTRKITQGEMIFSERPLLLQPAPTMVITPNGLDAAEEAKWRLNEQERYAAKCVQRMTPHQQAAFMGLHNFNPNDRTGPIFGRIRTNGIGLYGLESGIEGDKGVYAAVCDNISRLNHSCSPNTCPRFDRASFSYWLYAVRDIAEGEELTYQYSDVLVSKVERNEETEKYGFACMCAACKEPTAESDKRRSEIAASVPSVLTWAMDWGLPDDWLIKKAIRLLVLLQKENIQHVEAYSTATHAILEAYICLGDSKNASKWAARAIQQTWSELYHERLQELLDPQSQAYEGHVLWRMRVDKSPRNEVFKAMGTVCRPEGIGILDGGRKLTFTADEGVLPGTLEKVLATVAPAMNDAKFKQLATG
ncbi:Aldehyde dehydrogenase [Mycena indigotica]|uniref:Aldehyde dehydrogenase n=1 Tax=Mycena indigotica TaxID=2126181 RepID=A0A8H6VTA1_9AGAR|nr:Aldehyde dehydrogenase [Mycena indigotica]KAF7289263.1 Aldehyde dehydrogenase [Mycena indigotica]